jgi:heme oxygenase
LHLQAAKLLNIPSLIFDRLSYAETLRRFYGIYGPLERALGQQSGWDELGLELKDRSHVRLIARDLTVLGSEPCPDEASDVFEIKSFAHALGALYVMEGSTLGGRIILRHFETQEMDIPTGNVLRRSRRRDWVDVLLRGETRAFGNSIQHHAMQEGAQKTFRRSSRGSSLL